MRIGFVVIITVLALIFWKFSLAEVSHTKKSIEVRKVLPMDVSFARNEAYNRLNDIREAIGLNRLEENNQLNDAAQAHADYLVSNQEDSHYEIEGHKNFTGVKPLDRALAAGYPSSNVSENLSTKNHSAHSSIDGLFSAIYHRFGFLSTNIDEIGVAISQNSMEPDESAFVYLMGNSYLRSLCQDKSFKGSGKYFFNMCQNTAHRIAEKAYYKAQNSVKKYNPEIIVYPYDGQEDVSPAFYAESPDPLPDYEVSGFPVSIVFNDYFFKEVKVTDFKLYDEKDQVMENVRYMDKASDPHQQFTDKAFALFPLERLDFDSEYRAVVAYTVKGKQGHISWTFKTKVPQEKLYVIDGNEARLVLKVHGTYVIYFKPQHPSDVLKGLQFPAQLDLNFVDNNTIKITLNDVKRDFDIVSKSKVLHISIE